MTHDLGFTHVWQPPKSGDQRILLMLHGTGGDEHDLVGLGEMLAPGAGMLSPRGQILEQGMPRWFRRIAPGVFDEEDLKKRAKDLAEFVERAAAAYQFDLARLTAVGFSNGANIAAALLLLGYAIPRDAILLRAMVPLVPAKPADLSGRNVLLAAGRFDPMSPSDQPEQLAAMLRAGGATAAIHWSEAGHELIEPDIRAAKLFLEKRVD